MAKTTTINDMGLLYLHPGDVDAPHTIQLPDSTLLEEGRKAGLLLTAFDSTGVTITAHPSSASDKIQDPTSVFAAFSSTLTSKDLSGISSVVWLLVKTGVVNNTWRISALVK